MSAVRRKPWFEVDANGLSKLIADRGKNVLLYELIQNAWDQNVRHVDVTLARIGTAGLVELIVADDDPAGFADLTHAYTLFAESGKKSDPSKRGRFNLGEKLVLALCQDASISSTTGMIRFTPTGRHRSNIRRPCGSEFRAGLRMTGDELEQARQGIMRLLAPAGITTTFNGQRITPRTPIASFEASLPTVVADEEGVLRATMRKSVIRVYEPLDGESASIYELGIPVVETGDRFHVDISQKVPLNMDRDNVSPGYLQWIRTLILNHTYRSISSTDAATPWVRAANSDRRCEPAAIERTMMLRFGDKRVSFDPTDREANKIATAAGYTVVTSGAMSAAEWENVREAGAIQPAGRVTPSPKPYADGGRPEKIIPEAEWTPGMHRIVQFARELAIELMGVPIAIRVVREPQVFWVANYGQRQLCLNAGRLGHRWFDGFPDQLEPVIDLLIHEFGHEYESDHLSRNYYKAITKLAAKAVSLALAKPQFFRCQSGEPNK